MDAKHEPAWGHYPLSETLRGPVTWCHRTPKNWLGLRLALAIRHHHKRHCFGPIDVEALGVKLRLHPEDNFCENRLLFMPQFYDPLEFRFLARVLTSTSCFVDIGANVGIYSLVVATQLASQGRILAVEPDPVTFERLSTNLRLNNLDRVVTRKAAIGAAPGFLHLHRNPNNRGQNELRPESGDGTEAVAVVTLAKLLIDADCRAPDVLKIDIEGMEESVLTAFFADAPADLRPRHFIIEERAGQPRAALRALFSAADYRKIEQTRTNSIWRRESAGHS